MATRSFIIVANPKGDFTGIYCHWDGYPSHNGRILLDHHHKPSQARALIRLGSLSSLSEDGTVNAYHRDRGDTWEHVKPVTTGTLSELLALAGESGCEYVYLYWNKHWSFQDLGEAIGGTPFIPLTPESISAHQEA